jgi:ATP-dependent protease ClpP protease subunit
MNNRFTFGQDKTLKGGNEMSLLFDFGIDLANRRIYLVDDITETNYEAVSKGMYLMQNTEHREKEPIEMIVSSGGGDVAMMLAFYDLIRSSDAPIFTIITGHCCSAAVLVAACGHTRFATENAWLMHHSSKAWSDDLSETELQARTKVMLAMADQTYKLLARHSNRTEKWWKAGAQETGEVWLDGKAMVDVGVVDEVIKNPTTPRRRRRRASPAPKRAATAKSRSRKKVSALPKANPTKR